MKLLLLASLFVAGGAPAPRSPARLPYTVTATTATAFAQVQARTIPTRMAADKQGFTRSGNTFGLRLTNGRRVQLRSKLRATYEEEAAELSYLGKLPRLHKYVLHLLYYEGAAILLVDQTTGSIDTLKGPPMLSPQAGLVAATFQGYPYEGAPNGVEVFQVATSRLHRTFTIAQDRWLPYELVWVDEHSFILKCLPIAVAEAIESGKLPKKTRQNSQQFTYLRVTIR